MWHQCSEASTSPLFFEDNPLLGSLGGRLIKTDSFYSRIHNAFCIIVFANFSEEQKCCGALFKIFSPG